jgi:hypothetical protein
LAINSDFWNDGVSDIAKDSTNLFVSNLSFFALGHLKLDMGWIVMFFPLL